MLLLLLILRKLRYLQTRHQLIDSFAEEFDGERIKAPILLMPSSGEDMDVVSLSLAALNRHCSHIRSRRSTRLSRPRTQARTSSSHTPHLLTDGPLLGVT